MPRDLLLAVVALLALPAIAGAQSGPLTASLRLEEPTTFTFRLGPLLVSPDLHLPEVGYDNNVFDEDVNPKHDWVITVAPALSVFARAGLVQFVGAASNDFVYYAKYASERSVSRQFRGRLGLELSRFRPFISAAHLELHNRVNREIDLRARHRDTELAAGVGFEVTPIAEIYAMASRVDTRYAADETFRGIDLAQSLTRRSEGISAGVRIQATPFTTVLLAGTIDEDGFVSAANRDSQSRSASATFEFSPEAIIKGRAKLGYQDFRPNNPLTPAYKGLTASGLVTYTLLGRATFDVTVIREVQYSFREADGYYVETGADLLYTQRLAGPYDVQGGASRRWLDYTRTTPGLKPAVDAFQVGVGYNFEDSSRIGFNFEYAQRIDELRPDRRFHRRRFFGSYTQKLP